MNMRASAELLSEARAAEFVNLRTEGVDPRVVDDFVRFLQDEATLVQPSLVVRCSIERHQVKFSTVRDKPLSRWRLTDSLLPLLERVLPRVHGQAEFLVLVSDQLHVVAEREGEYLDYLRRVPLLRCDRSGLDRASMLSIQIPDYFMLNKRYSEEVCAIDRAVRTNPFENRQAKIMWRGTLSGPIYPDLQTYRGFTRHKLVSLSQAHPAIIDARFTSYWNRGSRSPDRLARRLQRELGPPAGVIAADGFVPFKYLISVDGVGAAWKRVATILLSGSVLLLQHRWAQFFYPAMQAWTHFVPLRDDLSDVIERYTWLAAHEEAAAAIGQAGRSLANEVLRPHSLEDYVTGVVNLCAEIRTAR